MKTLLILRHAKSSWKDDTLSDHDRPLNKRGEKAAPEMGKLLLKEDLVPGLIISSSALRARTTAEMIAAASGCSQEIIIESALYCAPPEEYLERVGYLGEDRDPVMVVGHNPGLAMLVAQLTGEQHSFPTAALAHVELEIEAWSEISPTTNGQLVNLWVPRELDEQS